MKATRFGDPLGDKEIDMGPLINEAGPKDRGFGRIREEAGAEVVTGGKVADRRGELLRANRPGQLPAGHGHHAQEIFGPVLPVTWSTISTRPSSSRTIPTTG